jgi:hypothetical protein
MAAVRARLHALPRATTAAVIRLATAAPLPPPARPGCRCHRCLLTALARLHAELDRGLHDDPAGALSALLHERLTVKALAKAATGRLQCRGVEP